MKIVLDTNVFVSGVFFGGPPGTILEAWNDGRFQLAISQEILDEYLRVVAELAKQFENVEVAPILECVAKNAILYDCPPLENRICSDADDDKFIACALASGASHIVSGDKHLLQVIGVPGIKITRPRDFVVHHLA